jgi:adenine/guanine/hypoxanthine permease
VPSSLAFSPSALPVSPSASTSLVYLFAPSIAPVILKLDLVKAPEIGLIAFVLTFFYVDVFDDTGTLVGVAHKTGLVGPDGKLPRVNRALAVDSTAAMVGAALGTSTTTSYIESAAGVNAGGRPAWSPSRPRPCSWPR